MKPTPERSSVGEPRRVDRRSRAPGHRRRRPAARRRRRSRQRPAMSTAGTDQLVPQELLARLFQRKVVPFLGAGSSVPAPSRLPTAGELARALVERGAGSSGQALEDIAEEAWTQGDWPAFAQLLPIDEWRTRPPNLVTRVIAELCRETLVGPVLTTNWDLLIESALAQIGQPYSKVVDARSLAAARPTSVTRSGHGERHRRANFCNGRTDRWLSASSGTGPSPRRMRRGGSADLDLSLFWWGVMWRVAPHQRAAGRRVAAAGAAPACRCPRNLDGR